MFCSPSSSDNVSEDINCFETSSNNEDNQNIEQISPNSDTILLSPNLQCIFTTLLLQYEVKTSTLIHPNLQKIEGIPKLSNGKYLLIISVENEIQKKEKLKFHFKVSILQNFDSVLEEDDVKLKMNQMYKKKFTISNVNDNNTILLITLEKLAKGISKIKERKLEKKRESFASNNKYINLSNTEKTEQELKKEEKNLKKKNLFGIQDKDIVNQQKFGEIKKKEGVITLQLFKEEDYEEDEPIVVSTTNITNVDSNLLKINEHDKEKERLEDEETLQIFEAKETVINNLTVI
ncbi:hypothetical protein ABK040_005946 [Willaertia magna]